MGTPLWNVRAAVLASAVAFTGTMPAAAAPIRVPSTPTVQSDVVRVVDSAKIIRRENSHHDGGAWKKRRHNRDGRKHDRDGREHAWDHNDGSRKFRPKATPKYAYDAYGNYRIYDGDGWDDWNDWDASGDWDDNKRKKRPRIYKMNSFGIQEPSPALKDILTAVPE